MKTDDPSRGPAGASPGHELTHFLQQLVATTGDAEHVRRFFMGLERGSEVPIIVTSCPHEQDRFVYYAVIDLAVERAARDRLVVWRTDDGDAVSRFQEYAQTNLIVIFDNLLTRRVLKWTDAKWVCFRSEGSGRSVEHPVTGRVFSAQNPVDFLRGSLTP
jgi:hypothetical protein